MTNEELRAALREVICLAAQETAPNDWWGHDTSLGDILTEAVDVWRARERLAKPADLVEQAAEKCASKRAGLTESLVLVFLRESGLRIDEVEMVERFDGPRVVWYLRKKGDAT